MEKGTLYFVGSSSAIEPIKGKVCIVETLQIDTPTDAQFYTKLDGVKVEDVPNWASDALTAATRNSHRITKMEARIWLMN